MARDTVVQQYIDDTASIEASSYTHVRALLHKVGFQGPRIHPVADLLMARGFVLGADKCARDPVPVLTHLGTELDTVEHVCRLDRKRRVKIEDLWRQIRQDVVVQVRDLARLAGLLTSAAIPVPMALFFTWTISHVLRGVLTLDPLEAWGISVPLLPWIRTQVDRFLALLPSMEASPMAACPPHLC